MNIESIAQALNNDKVGVLPTDTVYGVVGRLLSPVAVQRIYEVKRRGVDKRVGTILIADISQMKKITSYELLKKAARYWPGSTSIVLPLEDELAYAHKGHNTLAFRIPDSPELIKLLKQTGPLATSSANIEGQQPATTVQQARKHFGEQVDFYIDGGDLSAHRPSRIIELFSDGSEQEIRS